MRCYCCRSFFPLLLALSAALRRSAALVQLRGNSFSFSFIDAPARFAVPVEGSGVCGSLHVADPIDGCAPFQGCNGTDKSAAGEDGRAGERFVLIERGTCSFEDKVRMAQDCGFQAAIIYDDQEKSGLYSMIGNSVGVHVHAVFISKMAGDTLRKFARGEDGECCIGASMDESAGTVLVISFVSLVIIISVLATFLFARNCQILRHGVQSRPTSINRRAVEVLPCFTFKDGHVNNKSTSETCAICLEDYKDGERLRVLPCNHDFHAICIDAWLTKWGTSCPVCKHEMRSLEYVGNQTTNTAQALTFR